MLRYGLIGAGMMGQEHIRNVALLEDCEVVAVADPDEGMRETAVRASEGRAASFADHREMLASAPFDALVIASPNDTHRDILLDVLDTDLPILVEKPLCATSAHCREVIAKADRRAAPVWVAMEYRYMPPQQRLLDELSKGAVGVPRMVAIREHRFPFLKKVAHWNRFNARTGGTLVEKCCHFWDLMRLILESDPVRIYASAGCDVNHLHERYEGKVPDIADNAFAVVDFENGARGMLDLCMFAEGSYWQNVVSVTGEKARIDARVPGPARFSADGRERASEIEISDRAGKCARRERIETDEAILAAGDHQGSTYFQHLRFRDMVVQGTGRPDVSLADGLWSVAMGEAAEKSARTGRSVELAP